MPATRKLALIVRPALIAGPGKVFVWSDWSAIEARVTPWLADSQGGERPWTCSAPATPTRRGRTSTPSPPPTSCTKIRSEITKAERNIGKVATLALGFGGSVGALQSMALNYRINLDGRRGASHRRRLARSEPVGARVLGRASRRRKLRPVGRRNERLGVPGRITTAGGSRFVYRDDYLGGSLFMALPSGRLLTYPRPKWRDIDVLDKDGKPTGEKRQRAVIPARPRSRKAMARHAL